jgi:transcription elongation factor SPT6
VGYVDDWSILYEIEASKLLEQSDLWNIFDYDLKFRGLMDKRNSLQATYDSLISNSMAPDDIFEKMLPQAATMEELQDVQDYLYFQYASQLKDLATTGNGDVNGLGMSRKKAATRTIYEQVRNGNLYGLVRAFGITADAFAENALKLGGANNYTDDPSDTPENMADTFLDEEFATGAQAFKAAKAMFVEELAMSPKMRKVVRRNIYQTGVIDCFRTEKGLRKIDEQHPYYDFKYLRSQGFEP